MSDLEDDMKQMTEKARALGVSGSKANEEQEDGQEAVSEPPEALETPEAQETSAMSEALGSHEAEETSETGGVDAHTYPNPDKDLGALTATYENINIYVPPEVKREVNAFFKELDYEFSRDHGGDLDKHWDFYTAIFRAVLQNRDIVRDEIGMADE